MAFDRENRSGESFRPPDQSLGRWHGGNYQTAGGDQLDIYLKLDDNNWYYFGYTREVMQVISSDQAFNDRIQKIPEKQRQTADRRPGFKYMIASSDKLNQFLRTYQQAETQTIPLQPQIRDAAQPAVQPQQPVVAPPVENKEAAVPVIEVE